MRPGLSSVVVVPVTLPSVLTGSATLETTPVREARPGVAVMSSFPTGRNVSFWDGFMTVDPLSEPPEDKVPSFTVPGLSLLVTTPPPEPPPRGPLW